jgi:pyruvate formate lyase activating enzyme
MTIGGLQKVSLLDFPAQIAAIVFVKGCNFSCPFCFNRDLVLGKAPTISQTTILAFFKKRKKLLDGVVVTGGEPLLQPDLEKFIRKLRRLGFKIKLDTNGALPEKLGQLLKKNLIDYVAMDFKAPLGENYAQAIGKKEFDSHLIMSSLQILRRAKIPFELRTTVVPGIHHQKALVKMAKQLRKVFGKRRPRWYWQNFQPKNCLDPKFEKITPYSRTALERFLRAAKRDYPKIELRSE